MQSHCLTLCQMIKFYYFLLSENVDNLFFCFLMDGAFVGATSFWEENAIYFKAIWVSIWLIYIVLYNTSSKQDDDVSLKFLGSTFCLLQFIYLFYCFIVIFNA